MTDNNHPITPPPELVEQWECEYHHMTYGPDLSMFISEKAARWGADMELEACCKWIEGEIGAIDPKDLFTARRPKSPSLKEQALAELNLTADPDGAELSRTQVELIRRALESLPE